MPLPIQTGAPTLIVHKRAYEGSGLLRAALDERLGLTSEEFRVEGDLVVIGPIYDAAAFAMLLEELETLGLVYYDDFFELSGSWPEWVKVFAGSSNEARRSSPSQPQP